MPQTTPPHPNKAWFDHAQSPPWPVPIPPPQKKTLDSAGCAGGKATYTGHKQPGLHGIKSFGPFWGESQAYDSISCHHKNLTSSPPVRGGVVRSTNDVSSLETCVADNGSSAGIGAQKNDTSGGVNPKVIGKPVAAILARDSVNLAANQDAMAAGVCGRIGQREEGGGGFFGELDVVPSIAGVSRSKRGVELVPVRGISRVLSGS